jgi:FSR family fosmidomycin resistance protein-like MFS transporter
MAAVLVLSGLGVAAFHPEAARSMNAASGPRKATAMSVFSMGGNAGFALGPLLATGLMLAFGVRGALLLALPAVGMAAVLLSQLRVLPALSPARGPATVASGAVDAWGPFGLLSAAVIFRAVLFFGFNTFLPLYWVDVLGQSPAAGGTILSVWLGCGVAGSLIGGRLADRYGARRLGLWTSLALAPLMVVFVQLRQPLLAGLMLVPMSLLLWAPSSGLMVLGQGLLPSQVGVASGVTIGLSMSVGGATAPLLGAVADGLGIPVALAGLAAVPVLVALLMWTLPRTPPPL